MTQVERHCLTLIEKGALRLTPTGEVESLRRWGKWKKLPERVHYRSGRISYCFRYGSGVSTIYKNRLVWMIINKRAVPEGYFVDHKDVDRLNDVPENLSLHTRKESHRQGYERQQANRLEYLSRWFAFVGEHGREPLTEQEQNYVNEGF